MSLSNSSVMELVSKAKIAQACIATYTQKQIDEVCLAIGWEVFNDHNIKILAEMAVEETGMGIVEDKMMKHKGKILGVLSDVMNAPSVGLIESIPEKGLKKYAKPVGVVGALIPVTNPTATPGSNAISILKGRNAVICAPHPKSKQSTIKAVEYMRNGLKKVGAPEDLIQVIQEPSIELTKELMAEVDLVVATGGGPMVKAAYSSGTPSYGVGPGNSVQIIAEDANIKDSAAKIAMSKCFDNATSCSSENSIIIQSSIYDQLIEALKHEGGYLCNASEKAQLQQVMWKTNTKGTFGLHPDIIGKSALSIAQRAGLSVPDNTRMLLVEGTMPVTEDLYAQEKLSPVLTVWRYGDFKEGYRLLKELTDNCGRGHSCGIHTHNDEYVQFLAEMMHTSRIMVNQPQAQANGGNFFNGMPSTVTLGCGTWGGNITTENINYTHFLNITWVSEIIQRYKPSEEELFGEYLEKVGNNYETI